MEISTPGQTPKKGRDYYYCRLVNARATPLRLRKLFLLMTVWRTNERRKTESEERKTISASKQNISQKGKIVLLLINKLLFLCAEDIVQQMDFHLAPFKPSPLSQL